MATRRPSAALILGVLTGALAALTVLPTAVALSTYFSSAERDLAARQASGGAIILGRMVEERLQSGAPVQTLPTDVRDWLGVDYTYVVGPRDVIELQIGPPVTGRILDQSCATLRSPRLIRVRGETWAVACEKVADRHVIAAATPESVSVPRVLGLVLVLSAIVGIVTALGVLRLLNPLSRVSQALNRVGAGERGVRVRPTGLPELDELVFRLNTAARAMEEREDAIVARIQVVKDMARLVAHEVRNPLQSIELLTGLVASEEDEGERKELANSIHQEIQVLNQVVDRLLRQDPATGGVRLVRTRQSVGEILDHVVALRRGEAQARNIRLVRGQVDMTPASVDRALLGRSIENLVLNAFQMVPDDKGVVQVSLRREDRRLYLVIEDNGPGVDPAYADAIYEAEVTTRAQGTGLGLALVKGVVEAHGGYIEHDRSALGGARFTACIPIDEVKLARESDPERPGSG